MYDTGTSTLATLYDSSGSPIANPMVALVSGICGFQVADGDV